jgi:hypothetical protein
MDELEHSVDDPLWCGQRPKMTCRWVKNKWGGAKHPFERHGGTVLVGPIPRNLQALIAAVLPTVLDGDIQFVYQDVPNSSIHCSYAGGLNAGSEMIAARRGEALKIHAGYDRLISL